MGPSLIPLAMVGGFVVICVMAYFGYKLRAAISSPNRSRKQSPDGQQQADASSLDKATPFRSSSIAKERPARDAGEKEKARRAA